MKRTISRRVNGILAASVAVFVSISAASASGGDAPLETIRDVVYAQREDGPLRADVYRPIGEGPFPGVLCVHGGAWMSGSKNQIAGIARRLAAAGYTAVSINYRLAPKHKFPAQIEDCRDALAWVRKNAQEHRIDPQRLGAWGYSAGGHLVALLGAGDARLRAVVAGGAPCDFRELPPDSPKLVFWLGGTRRKLPKVYESASPASFVSPDDPPIFFYHGQRDRVVNPRQPTAMAAKLKESGVTAKVYFVAKSGHLGADFDREALAEAVEFLDAHLAAPRPDCGALRKASPLPLGEG